MDLNTPNKIGFNQMKNILFAVPFVLFFFPAPIHAQQVNNYNVCKQYREEYRPGGYDSNGNYIQGGVFTKSYNVPCNNYNNSYNNNNYQNNQQNNSISCDPTRAVLGGLLGGGIAAGLSRGDGYAWSVPLGAALGGAVIGCVN